MCDPGEIIEDTVDAITGVVDFVVDLVVDFVGWLNPIPEVPDFGDNQQDIMLEVFL